MKFNFHAVSVAFRLCAGSCAKLNETFWAGLCAGFCTMFFAVFCAISSGFAQNADAVRFDLADPAWTLSSGKGRLLKDGAEGVSGAVLEISGNGKSSSSWKLADVPVLPGRTAMLRFKVRRTSGTGGGMTGLDRANFDISVSEKWETRSLISPIPKDMEKDGIHLGQWMIDGTLQFAELELLYLTPVHAANGLGADERVTLTAEGPKYSFWGSLGGSQGCFSRSFAESSSKFNTCRWNIMNASSVTYRFDLNGLDLDLPNVKEPKFYAPSLYFYVGYHLKGTLKAFASKDGNVWTEIGSVDSAKSQNIELPEEFSGTKTIWIRFTGSENANCQLYELGFRAPLVPPAEETVHSDAEKSGTPTKSDVEKSDAPASAVPETSIRGATRFWELIAGDEGFRDALPRIEDLPKDVPGDRIFEEELTWNDADGNTKSAKVCCRYFTVDFYREDFGKRLPSGSETAVLWWCPAAWKVNQNRAIPTETDPAGLQISAARNDWESCQLVLNPKQETQLESISFSPLKNADGNEIAPENLTARDVFYHFIENPTDRTGVREFYPDALPPFTFPKTLKAGQNAPVWLTVYVPEGTPAGDYVTHVILSLKKTGNTQDSQDTGIAKDAGISEKLTVPLRLHVWDLDLPCENHSETAYGFSTARSYQYHGVKGEENQRKLDQIYLRVLSRYRISPYHPETMDKIRYEWVVDREKPENSRCVVDFSDFDRAMEHAMSEYHFTNFVISIPGMGGGTYQSRWSPKIEGFGEETVEYQAMFASCIRQIEAHLREKGWLDKAYVYWFDEPDPKDYEFIKNGMNRIKKYAPGIQTMLTEEPSAEVVEDDLLGKVDIWCPLTPHFDPEIAEKCRAKGERFWWYVCCGPRAPYCTEFIDHSAVEMRTWLWQTWQNDVVGTLIWATNYWTSPTAFPKAPQDPYLDPMSYVSNHALPAGTKRFWGNGDGRFLYPPLSCAAPNPNTEEPNFEEPVASIRFEMLREGLEDYEMLYLLREKLAAAKDLPAEKRAEYEALLTVPPEITSSMTEFSKDPAPIYAHRAKIAEAIEALSAFLP